MQQIPLSLPNLAALKQSKQIKKLQPSNRHPAWISVSIKPGDTLTSLFKAHHLPIYQALTLARTAPKLLAWLKPGRTLDWQQNDTGLQRLRYQPTANQIVIFSREKNNFIKQVTKLNESKTTGYAHIKINQSLFQSTAYLPLRIQQDLNHMFTGQLNLARAIHPGSTVDLLYEIFYLNGQRHRTGHVLAAALFNGHHTYTAFRYQLPHQSAQYYTNNGHSVGRRFLAFPLHFTRVSSGFSYRRLDPVTHRIHSHLGIDLAAPTGTKIHSIGNGQITNVGVRGGYGKAISIQHGRYSALYAHLSRYQPGLHRGQWVHKGDVIGYVGQTGWATGHHLHFGFYDHHKAINWLRFHPPPATQIPQTNKNAFNEQMSHLKATLLLYRNQNLMAQPHPSKAITT